MKKIKLFLLLSVSLNVFFVLGGGVVVAQKGGISYVKNKVGSVFAQESEQTFIPYYYDRESLFKELKIDSDDIVMLGDSLTDGNEWAETFQNQNVKNRGINADRTEGVLNRLDDITKGKPAKIFLLIGVNDFDFGSSQEEIIKNYTNILERIQKESPDTKVYIQSVLPVNEDINTVMPDVKNEQITELNKSLKELAQQHNFTYVDLHSLLLNENQLNADYTNDGIHLNAAGYEVWTNAIAEHIK